MAGTRRGDTKLTMEMVWEKKGLRPVNRKLYVHGIEPPFCQKVGYRETEIGPNNIPYQGPLHILGQLNTLGKLNTVNAT